MNPQKRSGTIRKTSKEKITTEIDEVKHILDIKEPRNLDDFAWWTLYLPDTNPGRRFTHLYIFEPRYYYHQITDVERRMSYIDFRNNVLLTGIIES